MQSEGSLSAPVLGADRITVRDLNRRRAYEFTTVGGEWVVSGRFSDQLGRLRLQRLTVASAADDSDAHLTARQLQRVPLGPLTNAVLRHRLDLVVNDLHEGDRRQYGSGPQPRADDMVVAPKRIGRPRRPDDNSREIALAYLALLADDSTPAMEALAGQREISVHTVRGWIRQLEHAGWLSPAVPGRPGRQPGPRLRADNPTKGDT